MQDNPVRSVVVAVAQVFAVTQVVQAFCGSWRSRFSGMRATDRRGTLYAGLLWSHHPASLVLR